MVHSRIILLIFVGLFAIQGCTEKVTDPNPPNNSDSTETDNTPYNVFAEELNPIISPIASPDPSSSLEDISVLSSLGDKKIVGLGEATHGTKEFFQLKHKIFKYLVEVHGFKAFAFEAGMGESYYFEEYVTEGKGDLEQLMKEKMQFWTWRTEEVKQLLEWMRSYNKGKSPENMIHYIGVDAQYMNYQSAIIKAYLAETNPNVLNKILPALTIITELDNASSSRVRAHYDTMSTAYKNSISDSLDVILNRLDANKSSLVSASSKFEFKYTRQLVRNLQQVNEVIFARAKNKSVYYRDKFMAENTLWVSNLFGSDTKIALWAHNAHIANNSNFQYSAGSQGYYIRQAIGKDYKVVGFSFIEGRFRAVTYRKGIYVGIQTQIINSEPLAGSINKVFDNLNRDNFILKLNDIPEESEFNQWLQTPRPFLWIGAVFNRNPLDYYQTVPVDLYYDIFININETTSAVPVQ